ncbi:MAG: hypothetical protein AMXMBFR82_30090 [Candidatus Hydrogenedentota bacterium]
MTTGYSIKECLRGYTNDALGVMCERWRLVAGSKASRIKALERILGDPLHLKGVIGDLDPAALRLLHLVATTPGITAGDAACARGLIGSNTPAATLEILAALGLVLVPPLDRAGAFSFSHLSRDDQVAASTYTLVVPEALVPHVPVPPALGIEVPQYRETVDESQVERKDGATTAFLETLRVVEVLEPRVTAAGDMHKSDGTRAREMATDVNVSAEAMKFALMIARRLGCVTGKSGRLVTTDRAEAWACASKAERTRSLFRGYVESEELPDLQLFFPQAFDAMESRMPAGTLRRRYHRLLLAQVLAEQQPDTWYSLEALVNTMRRVDENFLFLCERWRAIAANVPDASAPWRDRAWQNHEKRLLVWIVQTLLANFGMVDLADEGKLFRITPLGRYALGVGPAPEEADDGAKDAVVVQPDFEVIAYLDRCSPDLRRRLDLFCERLRGGPVSTYRLTQDSVYRGVRSGVSSDEFIRIIESHSSRPVPPNVREQFSTWDRKVAAVTIHRKCRVLEYPSESDATQAALNDSGLRHVGGRFCVTQNGAAPKTDHRIDYRNALSPCAMQKEGLALHVPWSKADLFVHRRLEELGQVKRTSSGDLEFELCKKNTRRDIDWGLLAAQLETLVDGSLAARYRAALRAWNGDVQSPSALTATLVRFEDAEACDAVLEMPEVSQHVEGRLGLYTLVVRKGGLTSIKRALKSFGMPVSKNGVVLDDGPPEQWVGSWLEAQNDSDEPDERKASRGEDDAEQEEAIDLPSYSPRIVGEIIDDAIRRRRPILIQYQSTWSPNPTVRRVNPVSLDTVGAVPSLSGFCHRLGGARVFKLSRIKGIRILEDETF